ncbi:MAG: flagellar motor switch protein FliN [Treponema sp.]|nr:flagellar motor switch protein FliN [Treponema sp.]
MSDGAISQDEIDALLSGVAMDGLNSTGHVGNGPSYSIDVPTMQKLADDLREKLEDNINRYTGASFKVDSPVVELSDRDRVLSKLPEVVISVAMDYTSGAKGSHMYLMSSDFALKVFSLVNKEDATDVDDIVLSVVSELVATHVSAQINVLDATGKLPGLANGSPENSNESKAMIMFPQGEFILTGYPLTLDGNAYTLWEILGGDVSEKMSNALGGNKVEEIPMMEAAPMSQNNQMNMGNQMGMGGMQMGANQMNMGGMPMGNQMGMGAQMNMGGQMNMGNQMNMGGMQQMMPNMGMPNMGMNMGMNVPNVQSLSYPSLQNSMPSGEQGNIGLIMDVFMEMTVELGRTKKSIKDILGMGEGTIIELDKLAGEPVDILVNHKPIAKGEVVVIDENFGVRVTEILSPLERVNDLN